MRLFAASVVMGCAVAQGLWAQDASSAKMAESVIKEWPAGVVTTENHPGEWAYEEGVLLDGMAAQWHATANGDDFRYIKAAVDKYVAEDGTIKGYKADGHTLDDIEMGRAVLLVYRVTQQPKYYKAAKFLHEQLAAQPRTASGGYWHKQIYPNQMWLDGAYMAEPFRAAYAATFQEPGDFDDIAKQLLLMDTKMRDPKTGLLLHGWDESKQMPWADKTTGLSPEVWARAMGWYAMALVDVLDWFPKDHPKRAELVAALNRTATAAVAYQDKKTGLWWQVMDKGGKPGNYTEGSASSMFVYALAKGVRMGYLPQSYEANARRGWEGIQKAFVSTGPDGLMVLNGTVKVGGLGGTPYRSGTFDYYVGEKTIANDAKGIGAFMLAGSEMAQASTEALGQGKTVLVDAWFNSQTRKNAAGQPELFHYKWDDDANSGFAFYGRAFQRYGVKLATETTAPIAADLKKAQIFVLASPDIPAKNPNPHYMDKASGDAIEAWVKAGGVLILMQNDVTNSEFEHFNTMSERFGIHFNPVLRNTVENNTWSQATVMVPAGTGMFEHPHKAYLKEISTITVSGPAKAILTDKGDVLMAVSKMGKGTVFAVVDPWVYNEYVDRRNKLPLDYDGFDAAIDLAGWAVRQAK
ncbi:unsaturated rhamnogalacturonyl hydrolase [Edaphobacter aggregans]|uniref:Unsaturated rhamnogalacturonyl hydrolase n=1 Tax=Edaphobacter aggregans TaxID=570835 RepID=A0A3R9WEI8_9BACT|nr:glycoside hydrolase family 88 protein [Edaphobacter aggregans]RSL15285.1 unsaturated rhamnogalacturonyl hydrolase [Edaphobacter aggregans]